MVVLLHGSHWKHNLQLRNFLRKNPEDCREYEKVKADAIHAGADRLLSYSDFKKGFLEHLFDKIHGRGHGND